MPLMVIYRSTNVKPEQYKSIMRGTATELPAGAIAHFGGFASDGTFSVVDVWESRGQYEAFIPKLAGVLRDLGIPEEEPELYEVQGVIATDLVASFAQQLAPV